MQMIDDMEPEDIRLMSDEWKEIQVVSLNLRAYHKDWIEQQKLMNHNFSMSEFIRELLDLAIEHEEGQIPDKYYMDKDEVENTVFSQFRS